ncbi:MAG: ATP-binding protein [Chloroflexota bacterium]|nr:ATP-binding protein [Chloroflexota bacterium]
MSIIISLLSETPYIRIPQGILEWVLWIILIALIVYALIRWERFNKPMNTRRWGIFLLLTLSVPITSLLIGLRLPTSITSLPPGIPIDPIGPAVMIFSAISWMLAAGFLGPVPASGLALFSGIFIGLWETHNPFTPLVYALLATLFAAAINQRYRKSFFHLIRHPLISAALLSLTFGVLYLLITPVSAELPRDVRLEYTFTHIGIAMLVLGIEFIVGGMVAELIAIAAPDHWGEEGPLLISPPERTIEARILYILAPIALILIALLVIGDWYIAGRSARGMIKNSMTSVAQVAAENVHNVIEIGQLQIQDLGTNPVLNNLDDTYGLTLALADGIDNKQFFNQFLILNQDKELVIAYPDNHLTGASMPLSELFGLDTVLDGFPYQIVTIERRDQNKQAAQISFIVPLINDKGDVHGVLIGRTDLSTNHLSKPIITSLSSLTDINGEGFLVDNNGQILIHSDPSVVLPEYTGRTGDLAEFYEGTAKDGTRSLIYYHPVEGYPWSVVVMVPKIQADLLSLTIGIPVLVITIILAIIAIIFIRMGLKSVTLSLRMMAVEAERISMGDLNQPVPVTGDDEVGVLGQSFEKMRRNLKKRLDELDRLFSVSQEVATNLVIDEAIKPVLDATLVAGASSVRVVLTPDAIPELLDDQLSPIVYGAGSAGNRYAYLDDQILANLRRHDRLILPSLDRPRLFDLLDDEPHPASLMAFSLRKDDTYYGVFWVAYDDQHTFSKDEVNYFFALSSQAAIAASNTRLYLSAEHERQRLSAIIASSPDPVMVTDQRNRLILANPAAWQVLNIPMNYDDSAPIENVIRQQELAELLQASETEKQTRDIELPDGKIYLAIATTVIADEQPVGRVCTLRDVTRLKELNALKSEFVSTVSHELRSPLTLIHGYATMVEMVGKLNEQQTNYLEKIIENVESMSHLVNNLLDLRRIESGVVLHLEMVPVREIVQQVVDALSVHAAQKRIQLRVEIPTEIVPMIEADKALLQKALNNLVDNAIKFSPLDGQVAIQVYMKQDRIYFKISDNGSGISPVDQAQLFEKFYHRSTIEGIPQGSGLGLAIVKSIADRHKGDVWVESQLGEGSTFSMAIPLRQAILSTSSM